jgi:hypothetical protein
MTRKSSRYPNTSWGREALWEDTERHVESEFPDRRESQYVRTYRTARELIAKGKTPDEVRAALDTPPEVVPSLPNGTVTLGIRVEESIQKRLVYVRKEAIGDALEGREPKYPV